MLNTGCMVIAIERNATLRIDRPPLTIARNRLDCAKFSLEKSPIDAASSNSITQQQLKEAWGAPDKVESANQIERWTYEKDWRWNGIWGIFIVIPVPLLIPTGHEKMTVEFSNNLVQSVEVNYQVGHILGCGLVAIHGGGWSCSSGRPEEYSFASSFCGYEKRFDQTSEQ